MTDDVVAELDRWLGQRNWEHARQTEALLCRARDEIVALRERLSIASVVWNKSLAVTKFEARAEALEEAARVVEMHWGIGEATCVAEAIRALKER